MNDSTWMPEPPVPGRGIDKLLCKRLGVPRQFVHPWLRRRKRMALRQHLEQCRRLVPVAIPALAIDTRDGYRFFDAGALPGWAGVSDFALRRLRQAKAHDSWQPRGNPRKATFLRTIVGGDELVRHSDCLRFMLCDELLDAASAYLGSLPQLAGAALWWTPPNDTARRSQLWHIDDEDRHQVKILVNLIDTGPQQGPFTLLPADVSAKVIGRIAEARPMGRFRRLGRLTDERVEGADGAGRAVAATGPAASGLLVDSSACLHHGSRGNSADRLVLMFHFLPWDTPLISTYRYRRAGELPAVALSERQKLALGIR